MTESKCFMTRLVRQVFPDPELPAMIALTGQRKRMSQAIIDYKTKGLVARLSSHTRLSMHTKPFRMTSKPDLTPLADRPLFNTWKPFNKYLSGGVRHCSSQHMFVSPQTSRYRAVDGFHRLGARGDICGTPAARGTRQRAISSSSLSPSEAKRARIKDVGVASIVETVENTRSEKG